MHLNLFSSRDQCWGRSKKWLEKGSNVEYFDHKGHKSDFKYTKTQTNNGAFGR